MRCLLFLIVVLLILTAGCTAPTTQITSRADPFIGTWEDPTTQVHLQIFENHSVIANAKDPCKISATDKSGAFDCMSYVFISGNWTYGLNNSYNLELLGNISMCEPFGFPKRCYSGTETQPLHFKYDKKTDSISEWDETRKDDENVPWQRISSEEV